MEHFSKKIQLWVLLERRKVVWLFSRASLLFKVIVILCVLEYWEHWGKKSVHTRFFFFLLIFYLIFLIQAGFGNESGPPGPAKHSFSASQLQQLRVQIMAYRLLARNQPLSQQLALAVQGSEYSLIIHFKVLLSLCNKNR